jgi:hypothetical protein
MMQPELDVENVPEYFTRGVLNIELPDFSWGCEKRSENVFVFFPW